MLPHRRPHAVPLSRSAGIRLSQRRTRARVSTPTGDRPTMHALQTVAVSVLIIWSAPRSTQAASQAFVPELRQGIALFDSAYVAWEDSLFREARAYFADMAQRYPESALPHYWQGVVNFHLVSYTLFGLPRDRDTDMARTYIDRGREALEEALERAPNDAESLALWGTLTGMKVYLSPIQAPVLGPSVMRAIQDALEADPDNPRVHYLVGVSYYFTPAVLGGGVDKGLAYMLEAEELFRRERQGPPDPLAPRWGYSTCLSFIGQAYEQKGRREKARAYYRKALRVNPGDKIARMALRRLSPGGGT
ncbi:MAG: tetratricopeptide repeat protein [Chitinivibrionales bacterium]|nr:tetratricopeptide repeat protein [Chitinivibrionales bacterium]